MNQASIKALRRLKLQVLHRYRQPIKSSSYRGVVICPVLLELVLKPV